MRVDTAALLGTGLVRARLGIRADDPGDTWVRYSETWCAVVQL